MIYLDNSATSGFKPLNVLKEVEFALQNPANPTRSGHKRALYMGEKAFQARELVSTLFNHNDPSRVIFTKNCTEALNLAIFGTLKVGGHVITTENEHNSILRPLYNLYQRKLIELTILPIYQDGKISLDDLKNSIRDNTYLVAVNHVSNVTGGINPIEQIGDLLKDSKIMFLVDNAQGAGYIDVDFENYHIDMMAMPAHKGLYGPMGLGFLLIGKDVELSPILMGGTGTYSENLAPSNVYPESFEAGTLPAVAICGAVGGLEYVRDHATEIKDKMRQFDDMLFSYEFPKNIKIYSFKNGVGIFTFSIKNLDSMEVSDILDDKYDIATRSGLMCAPLVHKRLGTLEKGLTRASFCSFNTKADCENFIKAIVEISEYALE